MNPKDPLLKQPAQHGQREVFDRLSRAADGFMGDQVAGGCVNLLVNVLRQSHSNWPAAERAFDELFGQTKQLLKNHYDGFGARKAGVFPFDQSLIVPHVSFRSRTKN